MTGCPVLVREVVFGGTRGGPWTPLLPTPARTHIYNDGGETTPLKMLKTRLRLVSGRAWNDSDHMMSGTGFGGREHKSLALPLCARKTPCLELSPGAAAFSEHDGGGQGSTGFREMTHTCLPYARPYDNCGVRDTVVEKKGAASLKTLRRRLASELVKSFSGQT